MNGLYFWAGYTHSWETQAYKPSPSNARNLTRVAK